MITVNWQETGNHLWQSTAFAALIALASLFLRRNRAQIRYALWFAASVKFLIPFAALTAVGHQFEWRAAPAVAVSQAVQHAASPFDTLIAQSTVTAAPTRFQSGKTGRLTILSTVAVATWALGVVWLTVIWTVRWRRIRANLRSGRQLEIDAPVPVLVSPTLIEPGIFGVIHPVLLLPEGIFRRLTQPEFAAVLAHEMCHVRRRDNLTGLIQMVSSTLFWFHPLVWWIGKRMIDERENACDEEVLRMGNSPDIYADSIMAVCRFYVEAPLACTSGVSGADLRKRIEAITANCERFELTTLHKLLLGTTAAFVIAGPIAIGVRAAPAGESHVVRGEHAVLIAQNNPIRQAPVERSAPPPPSPSEAAPYPATPPPPPRLEFDAASIKPGDPSLNGWSMNSPAGFLTAEGAPLMNLIQTAFGIQAAYIVGPDWLNSAKFTIQARSEGASRAQINLMLRSLLEDRFGLKYHREQVERPVYNLIVAPGGPKLEKDDGGPGGSRPGKDDGAPSNTPAGSGGGGGAGGAGSGSPGSPGRPSRGATLNGAGTLQSLADSLARNLDRPVVDKTGLAGSYKLSFSGFSWPSEKQSDFPSIFTVLPQQLGLRLEAGKGMVTILVIDYIERAPTDN